MEHQLDKLFNNKLERHTISPSDNTWARIEDRLEKKNNSFAIWRLVASVLVMLGLMGGLYWSQGDTIETKAHLSPRKIEIPTQFVEKMQPIKQEISKSKRIIAFTKQVREKKNDFYSVKNKKVEVSKTQVSLTATSTDSTKPIQEVAISNELSITSSVTAIAQTTNTKNPIVLEYILAPVTTKIIVHTEEKRNGFKKIFSKACDIKNGESGLYLSDLTNKLFVSNKNQPKDHIN